MKKYSSEYFGSSVLFARKSSLFSISLFRRRDMRRFNLSPVVFPALFLLIFSLTVSGGTALAATEGVNNNFFGNFAGANITTGTGNSFFGGYAGWANTTGLDNSFFGSSAGAFNTTGNANSFFGAGVAYYNTTGSANSFFGGYAGFHNTTGNDNSFFGWDTGFSNTTGTANSFFGSAAGWYNTTGNDNSFFGFDAGYHNTTGLANSFFGYHAGFSNTTGTANSFYGRLAGSANTVEVDNTFVGHRADFNPGAAPVTNPVTNATAIGNRAYVAQSNSLVLGSIAGVNGAISNVNVGIGTPSPARQLHLKGDNAVFRMDRTVDTASFMLVRTDAGGNPMKTFVVGTNASGANQGEFVINDLGTAVAGPGTRRMTITNNGAIEFTGIVSAPAVIETSSLAFKTNVRTYENVLDKVNRLRGVHFDWKESGKPSVGLIAEEVEGVIPEIVAHGGNGGAARGVNYSGLVGVLVEAVKEQQAAITKQQEAISQLKEEITRLKSRGMIAQK
jgi:hypothetical protein